jgi:TraM recognition site of TraD and TraG/Type IV secretion-system coupling protein DNA-binding domain
MHFSSAQLALVLICCGLLGVVYGLPVLAWGGRRFLGLLGNLSFFRSRSEPAIEIAGERLRDSDRLRHTHILGATGSGKTVLLENLIFEDLARGYGMFIIDPKGDRELFDRVNSFCRMIGRESDLHLLSANYPEESVRWNPCRLGQASEIQSKFINSWEFSEVYYAKACEATLLDALNGFGKESFSLLDLTKALERIAKARKDDASNALFLDLFNTTQGEWGPLLCGPPSPRQEVSLLDVIRKNEILFVDLPTEGKSVQSSRIGKLLLQEIMLISGMRKTHPHLRTKTPFSVFVDEFDAFATPSFATFLNKGRSSGFMIHICHQTLADLKRVDQGIGSFLGQIQGNINNRFFFRIDDPEDAETIAAFFGTKLTRKVTSRVENGLATKDGSERETYEFLFHPDEIKRLGVGKCIFNSKTSGRLKKLSIPLPNPRRYQKKLPLLRAPLSQTAQVLTPGEALDRELAPKLKATKRKESACTTS